MTPARPAPRDAFRALEQALTRRRFHELDARLRIELAAIGALVLGFLFWQVRIPLDGFQRVHGPSGVALVVLGGLVLLAAAGGALAGARHSVRLRRGPEGPAWLSLPLPPTELERHLTWGSRASALILVIPGFALVLAAAGFIPAWWLLLLSAIFVWMLLEAARLACWIAARAAVRDADPRPWLDPFTRVMVSVRRVTVRAKVRTARWRRRAAWHALCAKDVVLTRRPGPARQRIAAPLVLAAFSVIVWLLPVAPPLAHALAFACGLMAAATFAEWIIAAAGTDPFSILRGLPIGVASAWGARVLWAFLATAGLVLLQFFAARSLAPPSLRVLLAWLGVASLGIGILGANYAITLYPRSDHAQRMLALSLGISMAASLMIPLVGWILLLTALLHSARRLPRWTRQEAR